MVLIGGIKWLLLPATPEVIVHSGAVVNVSNQLRACGWVHTCGPRGCADCKDDGSAGYKECCGVPAGCEWVRTCGARGCADCKNDGSSGYKKCCGGGGPSPSP